MFSYIYICTYGCVSCVCVCVCVCVRVHRLRTPVCVCGRAVRTHRCSTLHGLHTGLQQSQDPIGREHQGDIEWYVT